LARIRLNVRDLPAARDFYARALGFEVVSPGLLRLGLDELEFTPCDPASQAYQDGADWVGLLFATYNGIAALYAFAIPQLARRIGEPVVHAINLLAGAAAFLAVPLLRDPHLLLAAMIGMGMAWASILTIPYALLAGALPARKLGVYMGIFNIFVVVPQLVVSSCMGSIQHALVPQAPQLVFLIGAVLLACGAALSLTLGRPRG
jgi:maltose/moltooligosaccharide transporter